MKSLVLGISLLFLSGCSILSNLLPSPGVNANVQAGKENTQQAVVNQENLKAGDNAQITSADTANKVFGTQIVNEEVPAWVWILMIMGWLLPSPQEIYRGIIDLFTLIFGKKK
jgi:hypothetical protein